MASSSTRSIDSNLFSSAATAENRGSYAMVQAGPAVDPAEIETTTLAVELIVKWSDTVLHVSHMSPARAFSVGEQGADLALPSAAGELAKTNVVNVSAAGPVAMIPAGATASIEVGGQKLDLATAIANGVAAADGSVVLKQGVRVEFELAGCSFEIAGVAAAKKVAGKARGDGRAFVAQAASFLLHAGILGTMFVFMPALASTEDNPTNNDQLYLLRAMLDAEQAREQQEQEKVTGEMDTPSQESGTGARSPGESGKMGSETSTQTNRKYALSGGSPERTLSRREALTDAENFGMVELLGNVPTFANAGPSSPWGSVAAGSDPMMANGNMWGDILGEAGGSNGLFLSGTGEGAGGKWNGVGVGDIGTVFGGAGTCAGGKCDGIGTGRLGTSHKVGSPKVRPSGASVSGRLPAEVIQRIVRQNFGRFRSCYEGGLRTNPNLQGRVAVAFTIGRDGSVAGAQNAGSDLPDAAVVSCVTGSFRGLSFPAPEQGIVNVTYPISFTPN